MLRCPFRVRQGRDMPTTEQISTGQGTMAGNTACELVVAGRCLLCGH